MIIIIIILISRGQHSQIQDLIFAVALIFKDNTFNSSGQRVENCSSRYCTLNDVRDGAIFIFNDKEFHITLLCENTILSRKWGKLHY